MIRYVFIILFLLSGCAYQFQPDTTTMEVGETSNGKDKNTKSIKQTFKWKKDKLK
tara:strand:- start:400 stop:564 length:165 start_codon:yes stop_codon:yes gene_type:complete